MATVHDYGHTLSDSVRLSAYWTALSRQLRPGMVVLDVGAGCGIFSLMACRLGARKVYAMADRATIETGQRLAMENGYGGRIEFAGDVGEFEMPAPVDLIVGDPRVALPLQGPLLQQFAAARRDWVAGDGIVIPARDSICAAVVEAESLYDARLRPWRCGFSVRAALQAELNHVGRVSFGAGSLVTRPRKWCEIDYRAPAPEEIGARLEWGVPRNSTAHGLALWFDTDLGAGVGFSCSPEGRPMVYGQAFLPWTEPVPLERGDRVRVELMCRAAAGGYTWFWNTEGRPRGNGAAINFRQSTLYSGEVRTGVAGERLRAAAY